MDVHTVAFAVVFLGANVPDAGDGAGGAAFVFRVDPKTRGFVSAAAADAMVAATSLGAPLVTHHAQAVVRRLHRAGIRIDPSRVDVLDSRAMAWLAAPDDSHESGARRVDETLVRLERKVDGNSTDSRGAASRPPLERFRAEILEGAALVQRLRRLDRVRVAADAARREGRVAAILGQLEDVGVGFDASATSAARLIDSGTNSRRSSPPPRRRWAANASTSPRRIAWRRRCTIGSASRSRPTQP